MKVQTTVSLLNYSGNTYFMKHVKFPNAFKLWSSWLWHHVTLLVGSIAQKESATPVFRAATFYRV